MSSVASRISGRQVLAVFARARVNEWTSIALLFVGIYICLLLIWLWFFGHHWGPAFPKPRTMFVLFIGTLPVWSALLALRQWRRLRRTQVQVDRMQAQQLRDDNARTSQITENQFQRRLLFAFGTLAVCSSFLVASYGTYEDSVSRSELDSILRYTSPNAVWSGGRTHEAFPCHDLVLILSQSLFLLLLSFTITQRSCRTGRARCCGSFNFLARRATAAEHRSLVDLTSS